MRSKISLFIALVESLKNILFSFDAYSYSDEDMRHA